MIEIENLSLDEWYSCLKPYQRIAVEKLVAKYGEEKAAKEWLSSRGPIQTATFGGVSVRSENTPNYWIRLRTEIDKLICGHSDYEKEQEKFLAAGKTIGLGSVTALANWIAPIVGVSPALLAPAIVLVLHTMAKMGVKSYCSTKSFN